MDVGNNTSFMDAMNVEAGLRAGLESIVEEAEEDDSRPLDISLEELSHRTFSVGALLGRGVHAIFSMVSFFMSSVWSVFSYIPLLLGRVLGYFVNLLLLTPIKWISGIDATPLLQLGKYLGAALCVYLAWYVVNSGLLSLPSRPSYPPPYYPPNDIPPGDIAELSSRLLRLESALASLSMDAIRLREDTRHHDTQLGALESQVRRDSSRVSEAESKFSSANQGIQSITQEVRILHAQIEAQKNPHNRHYDGPAADEEARTRLRELEERVGSVEGGVKEALDLGKHSATGVPASNIIEWWNKLAAGKTSTVTIKSSDGKDVTGLINQLVDSAVSKLSKDTLARPDYALYSGGANPIPSLTSKTYEVEPQGLTNRVLGMITGSGYAVGRPPVTALHHETHIGHCWPFAGSQGQLGVMLSSPVYISDVTIDHVAKELATDMTTAPRQMELWGMVEGQENIAKFKEWDALLTARKEEARVNADLEEWENPDPYPSTLPRSAPFMRITNFTYDIHASNNVQTFSVPQEIQDLSIDFGIVVLLVKSNWGREDLTCLYRLRVHGESLGGSPIPLAEDPTR
jgi:SUN domain-containing protein 1/2